jgi:hypothetical protein
MTAFGDMVSEEVRDRLDHLPHAILRLAARQLDPAQRVIYDEEWMPELTFILKGDEARPITRLYQGIRFAIGILASARRITRNRKQPKVAQPRPVAPTRVEIALRVIVALVVAALVKPPLVLQFRPESDPPPLEGDTLRMR